MIQSALLGFLAAFSAAPAAPALPLAMQSGSSASLRLCPSTASDLRGSGATVTCGCPSSEDTGSVWGTDYYTDDSNICNAARHAGVIGWRGGEVSFHVTGGRGSYAGTTRNGVTSMNYGDWGGSFTFGGGNHAAVDNSVQFCPATASSLRGSGGALTCACPHYGEFSGTGSVWGTDVYTDDSGICRSAFHAGMIGRDGGVISVWPLPGRQRYSGTARNGITSMNYGSWGGSFRVTRP